ncbi:alkaline phosphatase [Actinoplanes sp. NPDC051346]|uniref:alkaline phosphatase n=1 Tax=Actinoplanes sp. NPDC051346 TaxID=3155048 RepID=UPI00344A7DC4
MKSGFSFARRGIALLGVVVLVATSAASASAHDGDRTSAVRASLTGGKARNVILLVGDGMGDSEITIARNYHVGAAGRLSMDSLPLTGAYTTYSVQRDKPHLPDYVADSAATGTAWATGRKTYDGAVSVLPDGTPAPTILELAKRAGYRTGNVTTAELQGATPAVLMSHVTFRHCKGPESMSACPTNARENGGAGSIVEQSIATRPDVMLGGGQRYFDQILQAGPYAGQPVMREATAAGYHVVTDAAGLASIGSTNRNVPLLGVFATNDFHWDMVGPTPTPTGTAPSRCTANPDRDPRQPRLADMATTAMNLLERQSRDHNKGFFLQVEGALIDNGGHGAYPCGQIGATITFDEAVAAALRFQKRNPDTLVVVTADHGHTSQIVEAGSTTPGGTVTLRTKDDVDMTISYATAALTEAQQHTGTQVRIGASGPQAANVLGVTDQTDLFRTLSRALGIR